jgi:glyoxylase-like metal-dependent hydrolase (beta-lactamase superfamily II)
MTPEQACTVELEAVGIAPADVRYIVQSHLHLDHTGALSAIAAFPNATVVATRAEFEYAHAPDWFSRALYVRADFTDPAIAWTLLEKHEDGYDVYGDGVVRLWQSPGHSPGHLAIEVTLAASGSILLAVDAVATLHHWDERALPGFATSHLEAVRSVRTLRRIAHRSQSTVVPGHDPDAWPTFKHSPHYYE